MRRVSFRGLTRDVEVDISDPSSEVAVVIAAMMASWRKPRGDAPPVRYQLTCGPRPTVTRDGVDLGPIAEELDLIAIFEGDLYRKMPALADHAWVLHGAGLVIDGAATVLVGPSGAGKSTTTLGALIAGAGYLSDEQLAIDSAGRVTGARRPLAFDPAPIIEPPPSFRRVRYPIRRGGARVEDLLYVPPAAQLRDEAPLARLVALRHAPDEPPGLRAIASGEAFTRIWSQSLATSHELLALATSLAARVELVELVTRDVAGAARDLGL